MKMIQNDLLDFLEDESDAEDKYENFINLLSTQEIIKDQYKFKGLLYLINSIGNNHQRSPNFICKIERLLRQFKEDIQKYFSNSKIFELFKRNKRFLLFLIEEKIITIDEYIFSRITNYDEYILSAITSDDYFNKNYFEYFQPEIKPFLTKENIEKYSSQNQYLKDDDFIERMKKEVEEDFYAKRREGANDDYLCRLIRLNKIQEFIAFVEQSNLPLESKIKKSIFETNQLLTEKNEISLIGYEYKITLIEYASFYGSIDVIKYMQTKGAELTSSMWIYGIHSCNAELIRYLEDNHVSPPNDKYETILKESIKCHHNDITNYIIDYLMKEEDLQNGIDNKYYYNLYRYAVECHNYCFFPTNIEYKNMFFYLCEFDYYTLVELYLSSGKIDINDKIKILII
ncbi:hypothetical protein M9Y10_027754 [Tritrichomonas musculus]|uniref:DUF3447 domain-containing protein n=1 Tax=Tritrichomonas musculus TaxID=1915356 RepID=A0ABR2H3Y7_9EUKA